MTPEQTQELINRLLKSGEILATRGFELAVRQTYVDAWMALFFAVLIFAILVAFVIVAKKTEDTDLQITSWAVFVMVGLLTLGTAGSFAFQHFMNPQWFAVKLLLETFIK